MLSGHVIHSSFANTTLNKNPPVIIELLTTMSWHLPPAVGSCRRGRRLPVVDVARHRFAFSGQACCPWSAASPPQSRCWGKCSAVETWTKNIQLGLSVWRQTPQQVRCRVQLNVCVLSFVPLSLVSFPTVHLSFTLSSPLRPGSSI